MKSPEEVKSEFVREWLSKANADLLSKELDEASSLTDYAIEHRYPADIPEPTVSQAKEAIELAERVVNEVLSRLPSKFSDIVEESESWSPGTE